MTQNALIEKISFLSPEVIYMIEVDDFLMYRSILYETFAV